MEDKIENLEPKPEVTVSDSEPTRQKSGDESPFQSTSDGLFIKKSDGLRKLSSPLKVLAMSRDSEGGSWGRWIEVTDPDGKAKQISIPMTAITGTKAGCLEYLSDVGLKLSDYKPGTKNDVITYLGNAETDSRVTCVPRPGWYGDSFVLPDKVITAHKDDEDGKSVERIVLQGAYSTTNLTKTKGTLDDWKTMIGRFLPGNSRLMYAASTAFAAPLLYVLGEPESGGFNFYGKSSQGKTTALQIAGSVWGGGGQNGFLHTWRATANGLEYLAEAHNDSLLLLDEIGQGDSKQMGDISYMLANGEGKVRARKDGGTQRKPEWRLLLLSTGEMALGDKMMEAGQKIRAGQETRLVDIEVDAGAGMGIFEDLHDSSSPRDLADSLKRASLNYYGTPIVAFLEWLVDRLHDDREALIDLANRIRDGLKAQLDLNRADGQVTRVANRISLVAAGGELAIRAGIIPAEEGEAISAAVRIFNDWLKQRGGVGAAEDTKILDQIRYFIETYQYSRFMDLSNENRPFNQLAGYRKTFTSGSDKGKTIFAILPSVFKEDVCSGHSWKLALGVLEKEDLLLVGSDSRKDRQISIGKGENVRCYCIDIGILEGYEVGADPDGSQINVQDTHSHHADDDLDF